MLASELENVIWLITVRATIDRCAAYDAYWFATLRWSYMHTIVCEMRLWQLIRKISFEIYIFYFCLYIRAHNLSV
jgi:hypothetical protein